MAAKDRIRGIRQTISPGYVIGRQGFSKGAAQQIRFSQLLNSAASAIVSITNTHGNSINGTPVQTDDTIPLTDKVLLQYILANDDWEYKSMSDVMDSTLGSARGDIVFRNNTVWTVLVPGTDGWVLTTHSAGADPTWAPAAASMSVSDEGVLLTATPSSMNFVGAGVTATAVGNAVTVTIAGSSGGGGMSVSDEGTLLAATPSNMNFVGAGVTATAAGSVVTVTIAGTLPLVNGDLPGPSPIADGRGQYIGVPL